MSTQAHELPDTGRLDIDDAKERLRQVLRQHRRKRHRHPARGHDAVCESLTTHALEAVKGMDRVAAYVSVGHEPCTRLLLERLTERGVRVLLPVLGPHLSRSWAYYRGAADLAERAPGRPRSPAAGSCRRRRSSGSTRSSSPRSPSIAAGGASGRAGAGTTASCRCGPTACASSPWFTTTSWWRARCPPRPTTSRSTPSSPPRSGSSWRVRPSPRSAEAVGRVTRAGPPAASPWPP